MSVQSKRSSAEWDLVRQLVRQGKGSDALSRALVMESSGLHGAKILLGSMYHKGIGGVRNLDEAERLYLEAADSGSAEAMFYLAILYENKGEISKAIDWFQQSSSSGFVPATYHLGQMHYWGQYVEMNRELGMRYFDAAAGQGHVFAMRNVGLVMLRGERGVARIPLGLVMIIRSKWRLFRTALTDPESDLLFTLD